jgi:hypothetical protein
MRKNNKKAYKKNYVTTDKHELPHKPHGPYINRLIRKIRDVMTIDNRMLTHQPSAKLYLG